MIHPDLIMTGLNVSIYLSFTFILRNNVFFSQKYTQDSVWFSLSLKDCNHFIKGREGQLLTHIMSNIFSNIFKLFYNILSVFPYFVILFILCYAQTFATYINMSSKYMSSYLHLENLHLSNIDRNYFKFHVNSKYKGGTSEKIIQEEIFNKNTQIYLLYGLLWLLRQ